MTKLHILFLLLVISLIGIVYHPWFTNAQIIGGDWPYLFGPKIQETSMIPPSWHSIYGNGLGGMSPFYALQTYHNFTVSLVSLFHMPWEIVYKIFWFGMFLGLALFSSFYLLFIVDKKSSVLFRLTGSLIYTTNTYILMVVGGGQMGVGLAYAISPFVLACFMQSIISLKVKKNRLFYSLLGGLALSAAVLFDPRIAFLCMIGVFIYNLFFLQKKLPYLLAMGFFVYLVPVLIVILLHAAWLLPLILFRTNPASELGNAYTGVASFIFFSFGNFSHSFSLLQPNWPENIFGKIGFLDPKFLILPLLAYASLFFPTSKNNRFILFFCFLGLLGAFLGKGANEPFGQINSWLFQHLPGFTMFRDPTKFYLFTVLAYAVLIPYTLYEISKKLYSWKYNKIIVSLPFFLFVAYWTLLLFPAITGKLSGTFTQQNVPKEYIQLGNVLQNDMQFYRTLWVPRQHRFSFVSDTHPSIEAEHLFNATNSAEIVAQLQKKESNVVLSNLSIRYIIVPYDPNGEIFSKDRKYDSTQYDKTIHALRRITWLSEKNGFGKIKVFEIDEVKNHFWLNNGTVEHIKQSPDVYTVKIIVKKPTELVFVEAYNPYWVAKIGNRSIHSQRTASGLNSFPIKNPGIYRGEIVFEQKLMFTLGWYISSSALFLILGLLLIKKRQFSK